MNTKKRLPERHPHHSQAHPEEFRVRTVRLTSLPWAGGEEGGTVPALFCFDIIAEAQFAVKINFYSRLLVLYFRRLVHDEVRRKIWRQPRQPEV